MNRFEQNSNPFGNFDSELLAEPAFRRELARRRTMLDRFVDRELAAWQAFERLYRHIGETQGPPERMKRPYEIDEDLRGMSELVGCEPPERLTDPDPSFTKYTTPPLHYNPRPGDAVSERYIRLTLWHADDFDIPIPGLLVATAAEHEYDVTAKEQLERGELGVVVDYLQGRNFGDFGIDHLSLSSAFMSSPSSEFTQSLVSDQDRYVMWLTRAAGAAGLFFTSSFDESSSGRSAPN